MKYPCPVNPNHDGWLVRETSADSPHKGQVVCMECFEHIKWASQEDMDRADELEAEDAVLCPLMSGMVIQPAKSEVRPARLRFEGNTCLKGRCAWWAEIDNVCAVTSIAFALLESKVGG